MFVQFGLGGAPSGYRARVRHLVEDYLGDSDKKKIFIGRRNEIAHLNAWLTDPQRPRRLLLTAKAGCGKTALLVRWLWQIPSGVSAIFLPISVRYGTETASIFYEAMACQLSELAGKRRLYSPLSDPAEYYKERSLEALEFLREQSARFLLVIDGVDESAGWQIDPTLLAVSSPQQNTIVSARQLGGTRDVDQWLRRLDWGRPKTEVLHLEGLEKPDVVNMIATLSLGGSEQQVELSDELMRLSNGDPLTLQYWLDELVANGRGIEGPVALRTLRSGFDGYFADWLERQRPIWVRESMTDERTVTAMLAVLTCAFGPISLRELSEVSSLAFDRDEPLTKQTLKAIERFVIGSPEEGFVFSHPMLANYFADEFFQHGDSISRTERAFVEWATQSLTAVNSGKALAQAVPPYLVAHAAQHTIAARKSDLVALLLEDGWRKACYAAARDDKLFARDAQAAIQYFSDTASRSGDQFPNFAYSVRCALILSSIASLDLHVPVALAVQAAKIGVISFTRALDLSKFQGAGEFVRAVDELAAVLPPTLKDTALADAHRIAPTIELLSERVGAYIRLSSHFGSELLASAEKMARVADDENSDHAFDRARALGLLAAQVDEEKRSNIIAEALNEIRKIQWGIGNPEVLQLNGIKVLAPYMSPENASAALRIAQEMTTSSFGFEGVLALCTKLSRSEFFNAVDAIIEHSEEQHETLVDLSECEGSDVWRLAAGLRRDLDKASFITAVVPISSPQEIAALYGLVRRLPSERSHVAPLLALIPYLNEAERADACLEVFRIVKPGTLGASGNLLAVWNVLIPAQKAEFFEALINIPGLIERSQAVAEITPALSDLQIARAYNALRGVDSGDQVASRAAKAVTLVPHLHDYDAEMIIRSIFSDVEQICEDTSRAQALADMAKYLPKSLLGDAASIAMTTEDHLYRARALIAIARQFSADARSEIVSQAFSASQESIASSEHGIQIGGLSEIVDLLSDEQVAGAFEQVMMLNYDPYRVEGIRILAPRMSSFQLKRALEVCMTLADVGDRVDGLSALLPFLSGADIEPARVRALGDLKNVNLDLFFSGRFESLAPFFDEDEVEWWIQIVPKLRLVHDKIEWACALLPVASPEQREELLSCLLPELFKIADELKGGQITPFQVIRQLSGIAPYIASSHVHEILDSLPELPAAEAALLRSLDNDDRIAAAYKAAMECAHNASGYVLAEALDRLGGYVSDPRRSEILTTFLRRSHALSRSDVMYAFPALVQCVKDAEGRSGLAELARAVIEIPKWYP